MRNKLLTGMPDILRLTQSGQLRDATRAVQQLVAGKAQAGHATTSSGLSDNAPIEDMFRVFKKRTTAANQTGATRRRPPVNRQRAADADGHFIAGSFTNPAGSRAYKLFRPDAPQNELLPLVVMLHGCTQDPDDFAAGTRMNELAKDQQCFVLYPAQAPSANITTCWNWFQPGDQCRDQGEPAIIAGVTRQIIDEYPVDRRRVYIAGLSAGGAMAVIMASTYPELYAACGIHSGLPYATAHDMPSAFAAMRHGRTAHGVGAPGQTSGAAAGFERNVPRIVFHGDADTTVNPRNSEQLVVDTGGGHKRSGDKPRVATRRGQVENGHAYTRRTYSDNSGQAMVEHWLVHDAGHAWAGGSPEGSYTDPRGPDASREMLRFFWEHPMPAGR